jgi:hypothetical protein
MTPRQELALAEQHIAQAEGLILEQLQRIAYMEARGQDTSEAKARLYASEQSLARMEERRRELALAARLRE